MSKSDDSLIQLRSDSVQGPELECLEGPLVVSIADDRNGHQTWSLVRAGPEC